MSGLWWCEFRVKGQPVGKPAPKMTVRYSASGQPYPHVYEASSSDPIEVWKELIESEAVRHLPIAPLTSPIEARIVFFMSPPVASLRGAKLTRLYPLTKPDTDNLIKAVLDVLTKLGFWEDDKLVVRIAAEKRYHEPGKEPGCLVHLIEIVDPLARHPAKARQEAMAI